MMAEQYLHERGSPIGPISYIDHAKLTSEEETSIWQHHLFQPRIFG